METNKSSHMDESEKGILYFCKVRIAEKNIDIESRNKHVLFPCKEYLTQYEKPDFSVRASQDEIIQEFLRTNGIDMSAFVVQDNIASECVGSESIVLYRKIADRMLGYKTLLMHGAAIAVDNKCYVFIAPSGTGKTTHIMNWQKSIPNTIVVNGDKPLINVETKKVYGTPWCGKEGINTNTSVPLAGIVYLERGSINHVTPISFKEMLPFLLQQTYIPSVRKATIQAYQLINQLQSVPCYRLSCNMNIESAIVAYNGIKRNEKKNSW